MSAKESLEAKELGAIQRLVDARQAMPGAMLPILHEIQELFGFIPADAIPIVATSLNLSRADVHGVISFYHYFRTSPPGRNVIQICRAESCQAMGSRKLEAHAKKSLNIDYHQTTADGLISLEPVYCLGNCACSPSLRIGDSVHGHVDLSKFNRIIEGLITQPLEVQE